MKEADKKIAEMLKSILADQHIIYMKARNYHWNITGHYFFTLHIKFEEIYTQFALQIDEVAERIRTLGEKVPGNMQHFINVSSLSEESGNDTEASLMAKNLAADLTALSGKMTSLAMEMQRDYEDEITAGMLYGYAQGYSKDAWMLNSFLG